MPSARRCYVLVCFLIALVTLFLSGCDKPINLVLGQNNKIALNPTPGQHLVWAPGLQVQFLGVSPCTEGKGLLTECHVKSDLNPNIPVQFFYICKDYGCSDPEVDVGSGISVKNLTSKTSKVMDAVALYCSGSTVMIDPADLPTSSQNAPLKTGVVVNWVSVGGIADWSVSFDTTSPCDEASIQSSGNTMCTIKQGVTPVRYPYTASSSSCTTPAHGSLTTAAP